MVSEGARQVRVVVFTTLHTYGAQSAVFQHPAGNTAGSHALVPASVLFGWSLVSYLLQEKSCEIVFFCCWFCVCVCRRRGAF